uniref:DDE Tnp4 domain-containing protein n=1 Tax=Pectinophora gossypiella TaxID=13191 RepID=A0A1E1WI72_PECGO
MSFYRYLASGTSYKRLQNKYRISKKTLAKLIKETCGIIWKVLAPTEMAAPNTESWKRISEEFKENANFPHCLGALDGKHIRIQCPRNSGSLYFNYKKYNSIVLLALVDSNYLFTVIDVGSYGRENDSAIFQSSILGQKLNEETLDLPEEEELVFGGPKMPYVIVADEAFGIYRNLMRPYPGRCLPTDKKIFNYRLSRARRYVECVFGQITSKFRIFHNTINLQPDSSILVIKAACVLHNFIKRRALNATDGENEDISNQQNMTPVLQRSSNSGLQIRNLFKDYFKTVGAVPWQNDYIV